MSKITAALWDLRPGRQKRIVEQYVAWRDSLSPEERIIEDARQRRYEDHCYRMAGLP